MGGYGMCSGLQYVPTAPKVRCVLPRNLQLRPARGAPAGWHDYDWCPPKRRAAARMSEPGRLVISMPSGACYAKTQGTLSLALAILHPRSSLSEFTLQLWLHR